MSPVRGLLTPECRAVLDAALAALARASAEGDALDPRSAGQRNHDALVALCTQLLADGSLPSNRGLPATVLITMTLDQLEDAVADVVGSTAADAAPDTGTAAAADTAGAARSGHLGGVPARDSTGPRRRTPNPDGATARTASGVDLPLPDALRMAARAHPVLAVFDRGGQPVFVGRGTRLATPALRLAVIARDRGCTRPGCDAPPAWCEVHHLVEWHAGGPTDITNLALVCPFDHHLIADAGYTVRLGASGRIEWIPPGYLDPARVPRTNTLHHPPDLTQHGPSSPASTARGSAA